MDYSGSGDTYLTCGYLYSNDLIDKKDIFIGSGLSIKIAKLFPFGQYVNINTKSALTVRFMERFLGKRLKILPLLYESEYLEYSGVMRIMEGYGGLDFMTMLKIGLEHNIGLPFSDIPWEQPEFIYDDAEINKIFQSNNLIPGKTVLLAPYAGNHEMWGIPIDFYKRLTVILQTKGYIVCTNSGNIYNEPPIPGTQPLCISYSLIRAFCDRAGIFIGLRSGLCDIISGTHRCKKIIFYPNYISNNRIASHWDYFSLKRMELCKNVLEFSFSKESIDSLFDQVLNVI